MYTTNIRNVMNSSKHTTDWIYSWKWNVEHLKSDWNKAEKDKPEIHLTTVSWTAKAGIDPGKVCPNFVFWQADKSLLMAAVCGVEEKHFLQLNS